MNDSELIKQLREALDFYVSHAYTLKGANALCAYHEWQMKKAGSLIESKEVISKEGATIKVTRLNLTEEGKKALTVGPICSADGCSERKPCGPYCRDNGNFD